LIQISSFSRRIDRQAVRKESSSSELAGLTIRGRSRRLPKHDRDVQAAPGVHERNVAAVK